jgi:hypothetical protein
MARQKTKAMVAAEIVTNLRQATADLDPTDEGARKVMLLTKEAILAAKDIETRDVEIPEWGGKVRVRALTGTERDKFEQDTVKRKGKDVETNLQNIRARLVVLATVDEQGNRLFGYHDIEALGKKSAKPLDRLFTVAMELSGIRDEDVEELAKNSESDQSDDSTSA